MVRIRDGLEVPDAELSFATSRSGGPGGQNVNKVESRVTLRWRPAASAALDDGAKERLAEALATRITKDGVLHVTSQKHRTQAANRDAALARFAELVAGALETDPERKPTKVPRRAKRRRLAEKRRRGEVKSRRGAVSEWPE